MSRARTAPFKSDPTPALGVPKISRDKLEEEFDRARASEDERYSQSEDSEVIEERKKKAQPIMMALAVLAVIVIVATAWSFLRDR